MIDPIFVSAEPLESRRLLSVTIDNGTLRVRGSSGGDILSVRQEAALFVVTQNGRVRSFAVADVDRVVINGRDGDDHLSLVRVVVPATLDGNDDDDTLL